MFVLTTLSHKPGTLEMTEVSLAIRTPRGLAVVVGCSHPGVERILAKRRRSIRGSTLWLAASISSSPRGKRSNASPPFSTIRSRSSAWPRGIARAYQDSRCFSIDSRSVSIGRASVWRYQLPLHVDPVPGNAGDGTQTRWLSRSSRSPGRRCTQAANRSRHPGPSAVPATSPGLRARRGSPTRARFRPARPRGRGSTRV